MAFSSDDEAPPPPPMTPIKQSNPTLNLVNPFVTEKRRIFQSEGDSLEVRSTEEAVDTVDLSKKRRIIASEEVDLATERINDTTDVVPEEEELQNPVSPARCAGSPDRISAELLGAPINNASHGVTDEDDASHDASSDVEADSQQSAETPLHSDGAEEPSDLQFDPSIPEEIVSEMIKFQESFPNLAGRYQLLDKIGEGTFSSVYKAYDLQNVGKYVSGEGLFSSPRMKGRSKKQELSVVALKRIYVTSSPERIYNELKLLYILSGVKTVAPLIDVLRHEDQVVAVLPYYKHTEFRDFYRDLPIKGIKMYMWELLSALEHVHSKGIIHRDVKPTNFLYDPIRGRGVLVDFGLAEEASITLLDRNLPNYCPCLQRDSVTHIHANVELTKGYPKDDARVGKRANRAGTRGFRAPEVLLKCPNQGTKIDIWSAGIILLALLARRFPVFQSGDDIDSLVELTSIFGINPMKKCCRLHGLGFEATLETLVANVEGLGLNKFVYEQLKVEATKKTLAHYSIIYDTLSVLDETGTVFLPANDGRWSDEQYEAVRTIAMDHKLAFKILNKCLELDPERRCTATELLSSPWFDEIRNIDIDEDIDYP